MNIIMIIFDSLREDCIECLGTPFWGKVHTPNLNEFAKESFVLKRCYPESLPTLPARRAIYTGQRVYPFRGENKILKGDFFGAPGWGPISENRKTISEILQQNGYTTALISDIQHMFKPSKNFHRGFDEWIWVRGYEADHYRSGPNLTKEEIDYWLPKELQTLEYTKFMNQCLMNMKEINREEDYFIAKVMREATRWLEQNIDVKNKFLLVESWSPHEPWFVPKYYKEMYCNEKYPEQVLSLYKDISGVNPEIIKSAQANYSGLVTMCDKWFGYLYKNIKDLGMLDNTLIIITTDHGHSIGDKNYLGKRGYPSSPEVYNIPILLRHPDDKFGRGKFSNILVQHTDIMATILDIAGISSISEDSSYKWDKLSPQSIKNNQKFKNNGNIDLHGKSFFKALIKNSTKFRDHVTVGWGPDVTVITDEWWFNCKINGKGVFLFNLNSENPFDENLANLKNNVVKKMYEITLDDAKGRIPDFLMDLANDEEDAPGCSDLAVR